LQRHAKRERAYHDKERAKLIASIDRFVAKLDKMKELPQPSQGDCFFVRAW
jgi:hypothetical protein